MVNWYIEKQMLKNLLVGSGKMLSVGQDICNDSIDIYITFQ